MCIFILKINLIIYQLIEIICSEFWVNDFWVYFTPFSYVARLLIVKQREDEKYIYIQLNERMEGQENFEIYIYTHGIQYIGVLYMYIFTGVFVNSMYRICVGDNEVLPSSTEQQCVCNGLTILCSTQRKFSYDSLYDKHSRYMYILQFS